MSVMPVFIIPKKEWIVHVSRRKGAKMGLHDREAFFAIISLDVGTIRPSGPYLIGRGEERKEPHEGDKNRRERVYRAWFVGIDCLIISGILQIEDK
jgi:hypothetical protein